jgi:hypothetical protein
LRAEPLVDQRPLIAAVTRAARTDAFAVGEFYVRSARMEAGENSRRHRRRRDRVVGC